MKKFFMILVLAGMVCSLHAQYSFSVDEERASDPNKVIGQAMKTSGTVSLAIGVPCLAAGVACLLYANVVPNPVSGYTTSMEKAERDGLQYVSVQEYTDRVNKFSRNTHSAELAGYVLTPLGGALTIVGSTLYHQGKVLGEMKFQISADGAGLILVY